MPNRALHPECNLKSFTEEESGSWRRKNLWTATTKCKELQKQVDANTHFCLRLDLAFISANNCLISELLDLCHFYSYMKRGEVSKGKHFPGIVHLHPRGLPKSVAVYLLKTDSGVLLQALVSPWVWVNCLHLQPTLLLAVPHTCLSHCWKNKLFIHLFCSTPVFTLATIVCCLY